jgi:hypothetical protein
MPNQPSNLEQCQKQEYHSTIIKLKNHHVSSPPYQTSHVLTFLLVKTMMANTQVAESNTD